MSPLLIYPYFQDHRSIHFSSKSKNTSISLKETRIFYIDAAMVLLHHRNPYRVEVRHVGEGVGYI